MTNAMTATNRRPPSLPPSEEIAQAKAASCQLARLMQEGSKSLQLTTDDNRQEMITIPPVALRVMVDVLTQLGQGRGVIILPDKAELTIQEAADYINVSRPYVVKLVETGRLPACVVGTRRRIAFYDLAKFDEEDRKTRRVALDELAALDRELGL